MNILFLGKMAKNSFGGPYTQYEFEQAVGKYANCKYAGEGFPDHVSGEPMDKTVKRVMPDADWVIDDDKSYHLKKPKNRKYKIGVFINDLHANHYYGITNPVEWSNMVLKAGYDGIFMRYPLIYGISHRPEIAYGILRGKAHWVPWSVNADKFYSRKKKQDVAFLGAFNGCHPLRNKIREGIFHVARGHKILCKVPPVGGIENPLNDNYITGDKYSEALGSTRIFIFDCSIYRYPILKFFEGAASGCLVMSDAPSMGERLGFIHRLTYSEIDDVIWEEGLKFYLEYPKEARKIANSGMNMTRKCHSHDVRSAQFLALLEDGL